MSSRSNLENIKININEMSSSDEYGEVLKLVKNVLERDIRDWAGEIEVISNEEEKEALREFIEFHKKAITKLNKVIEFLD